MASFEEQKAAILHEISTLAVQLSAEHKTKLVHLCGLFDGFVNAMTAEANRQINELGEHVAREQERYNQEHKLQTETASKLATAKEELNKTRPHPEKPPPTSHRRNNSANSHLRHASDPATLTAFTHLHGSQLKCSNQWEHHPASVFCEDCHEQYCESCFSFLHQRPGWNSHRGRVISGDNVSSSTQHSHNQQLLQQQLARIPSNSSTSSLSSTGSQTLNRASSYPSVATSSQPPLSRSSSSTSLATTTSTAPSLTRLPSVATLLSRNRNPPVATATASPMKPVPRSLEDPEAFNRRASMSDSEKDPLHASPDQKKFSARPPKSPSVSPMERQLQFASALLPTPAVPVAQDPPLLSKKIGKLKSKTATKTSKSPKTIPKVSPKIKPRLDPIKPSLHERKTPQTIEEKPRWAADEDEEPDSSQNGAQKDGPPPRFDRQETRTQQPMSALPNSQQVALHMPTAPQMEPAQPQAQQLQAQQPQTQQQQPQAQQPQMEPQVPTPTQPQSSMLTQTSTQAPQEAPRARAPEAQSDDKPSKKDILCKNFVMGLGCRAGDHCAFAHPGSSIAPVETKASEASVGTSFTTAASSSVPAGILDGPSNRPAPAENGNRGNVADSDAAYSSDVTWESFGLPKSVMDGIYGANFTKPSDIQAKSIAPILKKRSVVAQAKAGSGKTAAFGIGMIMHALGGGRALCVAPTRELAQQCAVRIKALAKYTQVSVCLVVPEARNVPEVVAGELTTNSADPIVVGTPGAVRNLARTGKKFSMLVVDEADKMLDPEEGKRHGQMGTLRDQTLQIKNALAGPDCQVLLFSATFSDQILEFSRQLAKNVVMINTEKRVEEYNLQGLKYLSLNCEGQGKFKALTECYAIMSISQSVIFVNSKQTANKLKEDMENEGYTVSILHGDISPAQRDATMDDFRNQKTTVLIATDVFARGIDVKTINVVINFDISANAEDYYHRVGRASRFGRKGVAINLVDNQQSGQLLQDIGRQHGLEFPVIEFDPKTLEREIKTFLAA